MDEVEINIIRRHVTPEPPGRCPEGEEWQQLPELPTAKELNADFDLDLDSILQQVPRNDVTRPYQSKTQYVKNLYQLSREEGITLLRAGIHDYKEDPNMGDNDHTCVYTKVRYCRFSSCHEEQRAVTANLVVMQGLCSGIQDDSPRTSLPNSVLYRESQKAD